MIWSLFIYSDTAVFFTVVFRPAFSCLALFYIYSRIWFYFDENPKFPFRRLSLASFFGFLKCFFFYKNGDLKGWRVIDGAKEQWIISSRKPENSKIRSKIDNLVLDLKLYQFPWLEKSLLLASLEISFSGKLHFAVFLVSAIPAEFIMTFYT